MKRRLILAATIAALLTSTAGCASLAPTFKNELNTTLHAAKPQLTQCYSQALKGNRRLAGRVVLRLTVQRKSTALSNVSVVSLRRTDPTFEQCVAGVAQGLQVPNPPAVTVYAHYPLFFGPAR